MSRSAKYERETNGIRVSVRPIFLEGQSDPDDDLYVWSYTVKIHNGSGESVRLRTRHWLITNAKGLTEEVRGVGIVPAQRQESAIVALVLALDPFARPEAQDDRLPDFTPWAGAHGWGERGNHLRPIPCVYFDPFRPDAVEAALAALALAQKWEDSPGPN